MPFAFIEMSGRKLIAVFYTQIMSSVSKFLSRGTSRLIKWIYEEIGIALAETYVMLGPFQTWNFF